MPEQRRANWDALCELGLNPFKQSFVPSHANAAVQKGDAMGQTVSVAGRIVAWRDMGKSQFLNIVDGSGSLQIYVRLGNSSPYSEYGTILKHLDLGDHVGVCGQVFRTKKGEVTVDVKKLVPLSKAFRPPPIGYHGLEDKETRYRRRYLDTMANEDSRRLFTLRSEVIKEIRCFLWSRGYQEVETPMMDATASGASAKPFETVHNALGLKLNLRIAPEIPLKKLLVGGFDRVFEIGRNFRNEGISRRHNPEFTMLEAYQAYGDCGSMMALMEGLVCHVARTAIGTLVIPSVASGGPTIDFTPPWRRADYTSLVKEVAGADWTELNRSEKMERAKALGVDTNERQLDAELTNAVFETLVEPTLVNPTFVLRLPVDLVPLAKSLSDDPGFVDVFECICAGQELAPGYSELNDPIEQRRRLQAQAGEDGGVPDEEFLMALEYGMPPAGGVGIGIDRLCMALLGQRHIRDVILFPQMKPVMSEAAAGGETGVRPVSS